MLTAWRLRPLKLFFRTVVSEDFVGLAVLSLWEEVLLPDSPESQIFVPWRKGSNTLNRSKVTANATFLKVATNNYGKKKGS
jgi:hypothetical protein